MGKVRTILPWQLPRSRRFDPVSIAAFRSFAFVVETGGFSAAARQLGLSVSTVSKHVDTIEARLQTALLLRTTRRVTLTDEGNAFYKHCRQFLDNLDEISASKLGLSELHGRLRVVAPPSFTSRVLSPVLPVFLDRHPKLRLELRVTTATIDFLREGVDLAIRMMVEPNGSDRVERIGPAPSILCASPAYLAAYGVPERPEDLGEHRCLGGVGSPYGETWRFQANDETVDLSIKAMFVCDTGDVLRDACLQGLGIGGFYKFHVKDDLAEHRLAPILERFQADVSALYIVQPAARYSSSNANAFIAFMREIWARQSDMIVPEN